MFQMNETRPPYIYLKEQKGKVVIITGRDGRIFHKYSGDDREKMLYKGGMLSVDLNMVECPKNLCVIEFDHVYEGEEESEEGFKLRKKLAEENIRKLCDIGQRRGMTFWVTDHDGKSPHFRFMVDGLDEVNKEVVYLLKTRLVEDFLKEAKISKGIVEVDQGLFGGFKLIPLEEAVHWKGKYKDAYGVRAKERVVKFNEGTIQKINSERIAELEKEFSENNSFDERTLEVINVDSDELTTWLKKYCTEGRRSAVITAFSGICAKAEMSLEECKALIDTAGFLDKERSKIIEHTYSMKKPAGVYRFLKQALSDKASEAYSELKAALTVLLPETKKEKKKIKILHNNVALNLITQYKIVSLGRDRNHRMYIYEEGFFKRDAPKVIAQYVQSRLGMFCNAHDVEEIRKHIVRCTWEFDDYFNPTDPYIVCLKNGVLNLKTKELLAHDPAFRFTARLGVSYDPEATCERFKQYLAEVVSEDGSKVIQEYVGYCLQRKNTFKKMLALLGEADCGKTVLVSTLFSFFGQDSTISVPLQTLATRAFSRPKLQHAMVNLYDDLSSEAIMHTGPIKAMSGGGIIDAEEKHGDLYQFKTYTKHIFAANEFPAASVDAAYYDRWLPVFFNGSVEKSKQDPLLVGKLEEELPGILNWALEGYERLMQHGFSDKREDLQIMDDLRKASDTLNQFFVTCIRSGTSWISSSDLYTLYREFTRSQGGSCVREGQFVRCIGRSCPFITPSRNKVGSQRGWQGIDIAGPFFDGFDTFSNFYGRVKKVNSEYMIYNSRKLYSPKVSEASNVYKGNDISPIMRDLLDYRIAMESDEIAISDQMLIDFLLLREISGKAAEDLIEEYKNRTETK